jgi:ribonuclease HI
MINRTLIIKTVNGKIKSNCSIGVPQGDPMSPALFNIYTEKLHNINDNNTKVVQYADDFMLIIKHKDGKTLKNLAENKISQFNILMKELKLTLSLSKTNFMFIGNKFKNVKLKVNDIYIEQQEDLNYLGVTLDSKFNFAKQCKRLKNQIASKNNMIYALSGINSMSHPKILNRVHEAIIEGTIRYSLPFTQEASATNRKIIETKRNASLRSANGLPKSTPLNSLSLISASPPEEVRYTKESELYMLKQKYHNSPVFRQMNQNLKEEMVKIENADEVEFTPDKIVIKRGFNTSNIQLSQYSQLERKMLKSWKEISTWPTKIINRMKGKIRVEHEVHGLKNKHELPKSTVKRLVQDKLNKSNKNLNFSDGSMSADGKMGIGFYQNEFFFKKRKVNSTESSTSIELNAILLALLAIKEQKVKNNIILTDSQAACRMLKRGNSKKFNESIIQKIIDLMVETKTEVHWIPGHIGLKGNDEADKLAKEGCNGIDFEQEISTVKDIKAKIKRNALSHWIKWNETQLNRKVGLKAAKVLPSPKHSHWYDGKSSLNAKEIKIINRLIAGHDYTDKYLKIWRKIDNDKCVVCNEINDANHIILKCRRYFDRNFITNYEDVQHLIKNSCTQALKSIVDFLEYYDIKL